MKLENLKMDTPRLSAIYIYIRCGESNRKFYDEMCASTESQVTGKKSTEIALSMRSNIRCAIEYIIEHKINPSDYVTAYDSKFPNWAKGDNCKKFVYVIKKGQKKEDVLADAVSYIEPTKLKILDNRNLSKKIVGSVDLSHKA